jgi:hypothetical protein
MSTEDGAVYLVVFGQGAAKRWGYDNLEEAREAAKDVKGVVVRLPILEDYRERSNRPS